MTLGINMTESDPMVGWESIRPTIHPRNRLLVLSLSAWELSAIMVDNNRPWEDIERMQQAAIELEILAKNEDDCTCTPDHDCRVCDVIARLINDEDYRET